MTRFACVFHVLRALATTEKRICSLCIYIISVRTHAGCSIAPDLMQMGACNQGKRLLEQNSCSRGQLRPSVTTGENFQNARLRVSQETGKKKAPAIGFLVPFYVKHSKGFFVSLV